MNSAAARQFADQYPGLLFDALLMDATVELTRLRGAIYLDQKGRFCDGEIVHTSAIVSTEEGGRIIVTRNTRYLVQMRGEAAQVLATPAEPAPAEPVYMFGDLGQDAFDSVRGTGAAPFDRYAHADGGRECRPVVDEARLDREAYRIASKHVENLDMIYAPARTAILAAVREALA